jgi:hypothetical protein
LNVLSDEDDHIFDDAPEGRMPERDHKAMRLLDRALIGLLLFVVLVLLGIQAVHAAGG